MRSIPKTYPNVVDACGERVPITASDIITKGDTSFRLQVRGNSMAADGIRDGDFIYCNRSTPVADGEIVVAFIDNVLATVKRYFRKDGLIILQCSNTEYGEAIYPAERVTILGAVTAIYRPLFSRAEFQAAGLARADEIAATEADRS